MELLKRTDLYLFIPYVPLDAQQEQAEKHNKIKQRYFQEEIMTLQLNPYQAEDVAFFIHKRYRMLF